MKDDQANIAASTRGPMTGVRFYEHERRGLEAVAARNNMSLSDAIRKAVSEYVINQKETASAG